MQPDTAVLGTDTDTIKGLGLCKATLLTTKRHGEGCTHYAKKLQLQVCIKLPEKGIASMVDAVGMVVGLHQIDTPTPGDGIGFDHLLHVLTEGSAGK
jgi:hypothetical protein